MKTSLVEKLYYFSVLMGIDQSLRTKGFSCLRIDVFIRIYPEFCANLTKTCINKFFIFLSSTYCFRGVCSSKCVDQKCTILLPLFKVNNCNTRTMHEICSNVTTLLHQSFKCNNFSANLHQ